MLERAGLILRGRDAQWRPCRLETAPLETASDWIERYRDLARDRLDRLDQEIQTIQRTRTQTRTRKEQELVGAEDHDHQG